MSTIAAISTGMTNSGISIIRVSGPDAIAVTDKIFVAKSGRKLESQKTHTIHYGAVYENGQMIDEVLVSVMRAPHTYTAEDVTEINCHGGMLVTKKVLRAVLNAGAVMAEPGEFTKRAFLNGRIDLSKAEAVMEVIRAKNDLALKSSVSQLRGKIYKEITEIREIILHHTAYIEAALDDPEHISLDGFTNELKASIIELRLRLTALSDAANNGKIMRDGIRTVILGKPNVGKSSLLNLFAGEERAIVTDIAGTTRDTIEENVRVRDISLSLVDTAGIRKTGDIVEKIGVDRAMEEAENAELILYLIDSVNGPNEEDYELLRRLSDKKILLLFNKIDLVKEPAKNPLSEQYPSVYISAKTEEGVDELYSVIEKMFLQKEISDSDEFYIAGERQMQALNEGNRALSQVLESIELGMSEDFMSIDLMQAYTSLGMITGDSVEEDLINTIFREFCMGK